jgi:hypothetical protein
VSFDGHRVISPGVVVGLLRVDAYLQNSRTASANIGDAPRLVLTSLAA